MECNGCGNRHAIRVQIAFTEKCGKVEICDRCGNVDRRTGVPDVYFRTPYFDENLADEKHPEGMWIRSKRHKASVMKQLNVVEAGSNINRTLGRPMPYIADVNKRRKFYLDNFGDGRK